MKYQAECVRLATLVLFGINWGTMLLAAPTLQEIELAEGYLQGVKDNSGRIVSGVYRGATTSWQAGDSNLLKQEQKSQFFCAFDYLSDRYRFDRDTGEIVKFHQIKPVAKDYDIPLRAIYIRRPEYSCHWDARQEHTVHWKKSNARVSDIVEPIDVRCLGLVFSDTLNSEYGYNEVVQSYSNKCEIIDVKEIDEACRVVLKEKDSADVFTAIWFSSLQRFLPVRLEVRIGSPSSPPCQRSETTWQQISNVWVPKSVLIEGFNPDDGKLTLKKELSFQWESVNQPVPEKCFTPMGMDLPPETQIVSTELGKRFVLGNIGGTQTAETMATTLSRENRPKLVTVIICSFLLAILVIVFIVRRMRRHRISI
jgi:hypothetical protein